MLELPISVSKVDSRQNLNFASMIISHFEMGSIPEKSFRIIHGFPVQTFAVSIGGGKDKCGPSKEKKGDLSEGDN